MYNPHENNANKCTEPKNVLFWLSFGVPDGIDFSIATWNYRKRLQSKPNSIQLNLLKTNFPLIPKEYDWKEEFAAQGKMEMNEFSLNNRVLKKQKICYTNANRKRTKRSFVMFL